ncbi:OmpA family protein [Pseudomonas sp. LB3P31]
MTLKLKQGLWLWAGALGLVLLALLALTTWIRVTGALMVIGCVALAWTRAARLAARQREVLEQVDNLSLPPAAYRQPVILVCGSGLDGLFGESCAVRATERGCYLRVPTLDQLPVLTDSIMAMRPDWGDQLCVMFCVNPGEHCDDAVLGGELRTFNYQLAQIRKRGFALPVLLVSYLQALRSEGPWFSWEAGQASPSLRDAGACLGLAEWQRHAAGSETHTDRLCTSIQLDSAAAWLDEKVLPAFRHRQARHAVSLPVVCAITFVTSLPGNKPGNLWQQWLRERVALLDAGSALSMTNATLPFPDALLHLLPIRALRLPRRRAQVIALWLFAVAAVVALANSAWQNTLLLRQVSDDLRRYTSIPLTAQRASPEFAQREAALDVLRVDADRLDGYYRLGEPLALGWGLYRGERLRERVLATIAGHRYPELAPTPAGNPRPVRLDSLSLFSTGSAQLRPESTKVLIDALVGIKAQPGWLIIIAGHTDAVGSDEQNLKLSRARAAAVHEWMQRMGGIPDSCFAVQGFGKSQPIASNDTEAGRSANRRVEIRLVPERGACEFPKLGPDLQPPVAQRDANVLK